MTIMALADRLQTEADAYEYLEELRWPKGDPKCPHCAHVGATFVVPSNGVSRKTRTGTLSQRRVWRCEECRRQFSVLTGTPLHGTKISVRIWCFLIFEICSSKNGVAAREIERKYGLCPRSAWFAMHRIREMMKGDPLAVDRMEGVIVVDETYIGADPTRMNFKGRARHEAKHGKIQGGLGTHKIPVVTMIEKHSGEARSQVMLTVTSANLAQMFKEHVETNQSLLWTDSLPAYMAPAQKFVLHETVNHHAKQYRTKTGATTNYVEGFFSQLKRSLDGTHHHISTDHLGRYLAEFDYRWTHRQISDTDRMAQLVEATPLRRLTYSQVVA
jgi:transposase-like protein